MNYYDYHLFNETFRPSLNAFSALHLNARSIRNKAEQINEMCASIDLKFDVLLVSETWLSKNERPLQLNDYTCHSVTRESGRGGGVAAYVRQRLWHELIPEYTLVDQNVECLAVRFKSVTIAVMYRPPCGSKAQFFAFLENMLHTFSNTRNSIVLMGDMNINMLADDPYSKELDALISTYTCRNLIASATRLTPQSATLLDLCITNVSSPNVSAGLISTDISDHLPIFCLVPTRQKREKNSPTPSYHEITPDTLECFRSLIFASNWTSVFSEPDPNKAYSLFLRTVKACYEEAFPKKN